jgi:hypothetical protein
MASILTAEDVIRRIAAECAYVDDRGGVGIRLELRLRSCGSTERNSVCPVDSANLGGRNHLPCSEGSATPAVLFWT